MADLLARFESLCVAQANCRHCGRRKDGACAHCCPNCCGVAGDSVLLRRCNPTSQPTCIRPFDIEHLISISNAEHAAAVARVALAKRVPQPLVSQPTFFVRETGGGGQQIVSHQALDGMLARGWISMCAQIDQFGVKTAGLDLKPSEAVLKEITQRMCANVKGSEPAPEIIGWIPVAVLEHTDAGARVVFQQHIHETEALCVHRWYDAQKGWPQIAENDLHAIMKKLERGGVEHPLSLEADFIQAVINTYFLPIPNNNKSFPPAAEVAQALEDLRQRLPIVLDPQTRFELNEASVRPTASGNHNFQIFFRVLTHCALTPTGLKEWLVERGHRIPE